jgi:hypothetical protein
MIDGFPDYTREFYSWLRYPIREVFKGETTVNRIKTRPLIILGTSGIGKTTLADNIVDRVSRWYHEYGVSAVYTNEVSLGTLMEYGFKIHSILNKVKVDKIHIMIFDDATAVEVSPKEVKKFFSIRHYAEDCTGLKEGIVYSIFLTHDWYSLDKIFRRYCDTAVVLSVPALDEFTRRFCEQMLGEAPVKYLMERYRKASKIDHYKGIGFVKLPYIPSDFETDVGIIRFKPVGVSYWTIKSLDKEGLEVDPARLELKVYEKPKMEKISDEKSAKRQLERQRELTRMRVKKYREKLKILAQGSNVTLQEGGLECEKE